MRQKAQNNERIATNKYAHKVCTSNCFAYVLFFIGDTDHGDILQQISKKLKTKERARLFTMQEIWANNSVSVSAFLIRW